MRDERHTIGDVQSREAETPRRRRWPPCSSVDLHVGGFMELSKSVFKTGQSAIRRLPFLPTVTVGNTFENKPN